MYVQTHSNISSDFMTVWYKIRQKSMHFYFTRIHQHKIAKTVAKKPEVYYISLIAHKFYI